MKVVSRRKGMRFCEHDQKAFVPHDDKQKFCSPECRSAFNNAKTNPRHNPINNAKQKEIRETFRLAKTVFRAVDSEGMAGPCKQCDCTKFVFPGSECQVCRAQGNVCRKHDIVNPKCLNCGDTEAGHRHILVLVGVGQNQIGDSNGLSTERILEFLYSEFREDPKAAYVGFYLSYDFTEWLKDLPVDIAESLATDLGMWKRQNRAKGARGTRPVIWNGWHLDILPNRRLTLWPVVCECELDKEICCRKHSEKSLRLCKYTKHCSHKQEPRMHICDAGPFWQCPLLNVLDPKNWEEGNAPCTKEEYEDLRKGKGRRATAELDEEMKRYNRIENVKFEWAMGQMDDGLLQLGISLSPKMWYGPGAIAEQWFKQNGVITHDELMASFGESEAKQAFYNAARKSYYAGWFEIPVHGYIPRNVYAYDINSAYPWAMAYRIPCLLHGRYSTGRYCEEYGDDKGVNPPSEEYTLVYGYVFGDDKYLGTMLHRSNSSSICRPNGTVGWFWLSEIRAAEKAGLITETEFWEWCCYEPCNCPGPLAKVAEEYLNRLKVGKKTVLGKAIKLILNSLYGKFAQTVGESVYENWIYASLITSNCRQKILWAIETHPRKSQAVMMVATDGIFFDEEHPIIDAMCNEGIKEWNSDLDNKERQTKTDLRLGYWEKTPHGSMTLFKPGFYWDEETRDAVKRWANGETDDRGGHLLKARGVNAREFAQHILKLDEAFLDIAFGDRPLPSKDYVKQELKTSEFAVSELFNGWPGITYYPGFNLMTIGMALSQGNWDKVGETDSGKGALQSSDPVLFGKRAYPVYIENDLIRTQVPELADNALHTMPYEKKYGEEDPFREAEYDKVGHMDPLGLFFTEIVENQNG